MTTPRPASSLPRALGLIAPLGLAAMPAGAATLQANSRIEQVTLYPDAALVTRSLAIEIPAGSHDILLPDLPMTADPASLRVEASGTGRLLVGGIDLRMGVAEPKADAELEARLRARREARDRLADRLDTTETRKAMVQRLVQGDPAPKDGKPLDLESWLNAVDAVGKTLQTLNDELRGLRIEEAKINEEIAALEAAIGQPPRRTRAASRPSPWKLRRRSRRHSRCPIAWQGHLGDRSMMRGSIRAVRSRRSNSRGARSSASAQARIGGRPRWFSPPCACSAVRPHPCSAARGLASMNRPRFACRHYPPRRRQKLWPCRLLGTSARR